MERFASTDVYQTPEWADLHSRGGEPFLVVAESIDSILAFPITVYSIPTHLTLTALYDAESPYGYPGVLFSGDINRLDSCWELVLSTLKERSIINCFLRFNPFLDVSCASRFLFGIDHPTVYIPMQGGKKAAFDGSECHTYRSQVRRAMRDGFRAECLTELQDFDLVLFQDMYNETMARLDAAIEYRFKLEYYRGLVASFPERMAMIRVSNPKGGIEAQAIFIAGMKTGHYHLSARLSNAHNAASSLLFDAAYDWAFGLNLSAIHLGGGTTSDPADPLFRFKKSIGKGRASFRIGGLVSDPDWHKKLTQGNASCAPNKFQSYRQ